MEWLCWTQAVVASVLAILLGIRLIGTAIDWYYLPPAPPEPRGRSGRNRWVAAGLAAFLGGLGIHRFYLGQSWRGATYFVFCWTFIPALISLFDMVTLLAMSDEQFNEVYG